jgi:dTDP-glucose 4,6-dehydratase
MNVLITGGAGFIGSNFVRMLCAGRLGITPSKVSVLDKLTYAGKLENISDLIATGAIEFIKGDICDSQLVAKHTANIDLIVNFAAESHVDRSISDGYDFVKTNVLGTQNLLHHAVKNNVSQFLQISTDEVYGSISKGKWNEEWPLHPSSPYSSSKAAADLLALAYSKTFGLDVRITRSCNNYGPRQHSEKLIPLLISKIINEEDLPIYGNGSQIREWIHVDDNCEGIAKVITSGEAGQVYNIGTEVNFSNHQIADILLDYMKPNKSKVIFVPDRKGHDFRYAISSQKINAIDFVPKINFYDGLSATVGWYKNIYIGNRPQPGDKN